MLYCFHLVHGLGKGSRVVKKLPSGCRERLRPKPWHQGDAEGPLKGLWTPAALVMLEGEPFKELLAPPRLGAGSPRGPPGGRHLPDEFHLFTRGRLCRKSELGVCAAAAGARRPRRAWLGFFSRAVEAFTAPGVSPHSSWDGVCTSRKRVSHRPAPRWFCIFKRYWAPWRFSSAHLSRCPRPTEAEVEARGEVGVGGPQTQVEQAVISGLPLGGIILTNLGARGWSTLRS